MNAKEGLRRLGLVAGVLGACAGAFVSYVQLQTLLSQRAQYKAVEKEIKSAREGARSAAAHPAWTPPAADAAAAGQNSPRATPQTSTPKTIDYSALAAQARDGQTFGPAPPKTPGQMGQYSDADIDKPAQPPLPPGFTSIPIAQGAVLDQGPPTFAAYLLLIVFPAIGFLLPWGSIRALSWVLAGFSNPSRN